MSSVRNQFSPLVNDPPPTPHGVGQGTSWLPSLPFAIVLFVVWVILSGKFDAFHLSVGGITALMTARLSLYLIRLQPPMGRLNDQPLRGVSWLRVLAYVPWLSWQVTLSSLQIVRVVFDPKLPVRPRIIRFSGDLPHTLARLTLSHSITLTPGTVTLEVEDDEFEVHVLTPVLAEALESGEMQNRVAALFKGGAEKEKEL